jgi:hypoxanthine-guanine phosphoribosyltransferase
MIYKQSVLIAVPVLNGGLVWKNSIKRLLEYKDTYDFLIIGSGSKDESVKHASRLTSNFYPSINMILTMDEPANLDRCYQQLKYSNK